MYVDGTTLFNAFQSFKTSTKEVNVDTLINNELAQISELLKINKLILNINKSKYILYQMINKALNIPVLKIDATVTLSTINISVDLVVTLFAVLPDIFIERTLSIRLPYSITK